jgi:transcriptional regulator with XRE-family HTH domain
MIDIKRFRIDEGIQQKEICKILGIAQPYLSAIERGERPLNKDKFKILYKQYGDILLNYKTADIVINLNDKPTEQSKQLIPFYDDAATIGGVNEKISNMQGVSSPSEYIDAGDWFREATAAIRHYGDSMIEYPPGCILALKEVQERQLIIWGKDYVIETSEYRITKRVQRGDNSEYIKAYSSNIETYPDGKLIHEPQDIPWKYIRRIFLVLGYVVKKNGGTIVFSNQQK